MLVDQSVQCAQQDQEPAEDPTAKRKLAARISRHLSHGSVSRASKAIDSLPLAEVNDEVVHALRDLHPQHDPPNGPEPTAPPLHVTKDLFTSVLKKRPTAQRLATTAGPTSTSETRSKQPQRLQPQQWSV